MADNIKSYNLIAKSWDKYRKSKAIDPCILKYADYIKPKGLVLDIGCGSGYPIDVFLDSKGFKIIGIDFAEEMISIAKTLKLKNSKFEVCDIHDFETDLSFDAVIAFDSIFHIKKEEQRFIFNKISKMLKPGGLMLFTCGLIESDIEGEMFGQPFEYSSLDASTLKEYLNGLNFEIIEWSEHYSDPISGDRDLLVVLRKRLIKKKGP